METKPDGNREAPPLPELLVRQCSWCEREIGDDGYAIGERMPAESATNRTYGICQACAATMMAAYERERQQER